MVYNSLGILDKVLKDVTFRCIVKVIKMHVLPDMFLNIIIIQLM